GSPAAPPACASGTWRRRPPRAARSRWSPKGIGSASTWPPARWTCWWTPGSWTAAGPAGRHRRPASRPACWPSTPSWAAPPPTAPSAAARPAGRPSCPPQQATHPINRVRSVVALTTDSHGGGGDQALTAEQAGGVDLGGERPVQPERVTLAALDDERVG